MADQQLNPAGDILANEKPLITLRQARRILGKKASNSLTDADLSRVIRMMSSLAEDLMCNNQVPKNDKVV